MKKIMILGASILQLPAIQKAKQMGLYVLAVDRDKNAVGVPYADHFLEISTIDTSKVLEAAIENRIDAIMTLASDMPMATVAEVCDKMHLTGVSPLTAYYATNKAAMRGRLMEKGVPVPQFRKVTSLEEYRQAVPFFPGKFMVKAADNSGKRGVFLVSNPDNEEMVQYAFDYAMENSRCKELVVEDFMEGKEVSVETLSIRGKTFVLAITDKMNLGAPRFVEMGHSQPSQLDKKTQEEISKVAIDAIEAIGISDGPSHTEVMVTPFGAKIVELGARLGGDNITTHLVPLSTGVDMVECCISIALGNNPSITKKWEKGSAIRYFETQRPGILQNFYGLEEAKSLPGIVNIQIVKHIGDKVEVPKNSGDRLGFVISQGESAQIAIDRCNRAINNISFEIW